MIVVTGSTGRVGGLAARRLESGGHQMGLLVRDTDRTPRIHDAQVKGADYANSEALAEGLRKGDRVFMVSLWIGGDTRLDLHRSFIEAAAKADVAQLVYLPFVKRGPDRDFLPCARARRHRGDAEGIRRAVDIDSQQHVRRRHPWVV